MWGGTPVFLSDSFADNPGRTILRFGVDLRKIFTHDAKEKALDSAEEENQQNDRRPSGRWRSNRRISMPRQKCQRDVGDSAKDAGECRCDADEAGETKGFVRKRHHRGDGVLDAPPQRRVGFAVTASRAFKLKTCLFEAGPMSQPPHVTDSLLAVFEGVDDGPREKSKIGRVDRNFHIAQHENQTVGDFRAPGFENRLIRPFRQNAVNQVVTLLPFFDHGRNHLGRVLKIAKEINQSVARGVRGAREERSFDAEIASEANVFPTRIRLRHFQATQARRIGTAIVDQQNFESIVWKTIHDGVHAPKNFAEVFLFVVDGNRNGHELL